MTRPPATLAPSRAPPSPDEGAVEGQGLPADVEGPKTVAPEVLATEAPIVVVEGGFCHVVYGGPTT